MKKTFIASALAVCLGLGFASLAESSPTDKPKEEDRGCWVYDSLENAGRYTCAVSEGFGEPVVKPAGKGFYVIGFYILHDGVYMPTGNKPYIEVIKVNDQRVKASVFIGEDTSMVIIPSTVKGSDFVINEFKNKKTVLVKTSLMPTQKLYSAKGFNKMLQQIDTKEAI